VSGGTEIGATGRCRWCRQPIVFERYMEDEGPVTWRHLTSNKPPLLDHLRNRASHASCGQFFAQPAPEIVVLCGSTRFYEAFQQANYDFTMAGKIVLSVGFYPHSKAKCGHGEGLGHDSAEKVALDELHKRKIDLADSVFVLNVDGYIGDSTRSEIAHAEAIGRPIAYLEPTS